jgi:glycine dehydrogenase
LHKTFAIPHGGGGPGAGPVAVAKHLVDFLPEHSYSEKQSVKNLTAVSSAEFGSAGILPIPYAYILMSGGYGLKRATEIAILNANYIKARLEKYYPVLYSGSKCRVAHELIFDLRDIKHHCNVDVEDVAKRLMDYSFHAPTVSFPVHGTLMVEPTESEPKKELDRFCDAMISIRNEIKEVEEGKMSETDNVFKNAPHTAFEISSDEWNHPYSREKAVFPVINLRTNKFWPTVGRVNNAYGDRNLVCSCPPVSDYEK